MYKISVIMATYNRAKTLRAAIESVLSQDFHHFFELILVDDGSTDGSEAIARKYSQDLRIKYYKITNGGQSKALNFGLSVAKGEQSLFLPLSASPDASLAPEKK